MKKVLTSAILIAIIAIAPSLAKAQTKRIALQSHSGKMANLKNEKDGNFGIPVINKKDTAIVKADSTVPQKASLKKKSKKKIKAKASGK